MKLIKIKSGGIIVSDDVSVVNEDGILFRFSREGQDYAVMEGTDGDGEFTGLRESFQTLSASDYEAAAKGSELLHWHHTVRFCSRCGGVLERTAEICKRCSDCGAEYFPTLAPAAIVLVTKGDQALLVHARSFKRRFFGLVAGFVETGESIEETVRREVLEETSLEIDDIRYFGSQSWPFPSQLMIGFTARWKSGDVVFADGELSEGGFFTRDSLPELPSLPSIARRMIDDWIGKGTRS